MSSSLESYRRKDRDVFPVGFDLGGAIKAYKASSKDQIAALKRRIAKPSERRRLKAAIARKRTTKRKKAVEHQRRPWQSQEKRKPSNSRASDTTRMSAQR